MENPKKRWSFRGSPMIQGSKAKPKAPHLPPSRIPGIFWVSLESLGTWRDWPWITKHPAANEYCNCFVSLPVTIATKKRSPKPLNISDVLIWQLDLLLGIITSLWDEVKWSHLDGLWDGLFLDENHVIWSIAPPVIIHFSGIFHHKPSILSSGKPPVVSLRLPRGPQPSIGGPHHPHDQLSNVLRTCGKWKRQCFAGQACMRLYVHLQCLSIYLSNLI